MYEVVKANDVRMCQFQAALGLTFKLIQHRTLLNDQVGKKFERDIPLQFFIARQPDNSHSSFAQNLNERIAAEESLSGDKLTLRHA